jgi:hypothetical protein
MEREVNTLNEAKARHEEASNVWYERKQIVAKINQSILEAESEIQCIDRDRPSLLASLIIKGGDFTLDANQQRRRRDLQLLVERYRLAAPVLHGIASDADDAQLNAFFECKEVKRASRNRKELVVQPQIGKE